MDKDLEVLEETSVVPKDGCKNCLGKPTKTLTKEKEEELIESILKILKQQKITYVECNKILSCVGVRLNKLQNYLVY